MGSDKKKPTTPPITRALSHYEAALSLFQQIDAYLTPAQRMQIEELATRIVNEHRPSLMPMTYLTYLHEAGDVFRAAKQILDPDRKVPSTTPDLPDPINV